MLDGYGGLQKIYTPLDWEYYRDVRSPSPKPIEPKKLPTITSAGRPIGASSSSGTSHCPFHFPPLQCVSSVSSSSGSGSMAVRSRLKLNSPRKALHLLCLLPPHQQPSPLSVFPSILWIRRCPPLRSPPYLPRGPLLSDGTDSFPLLPS